MTTPISIVIIRLHTSLRIKDHFLLHSDGEDIEIDSGY